MSLSSGRDRVGAVSLVVAKFIFCKCLREHGTHNLSSRGHGSERLRVPLLYKSFCPSKLWKIGTRGLSNQGK